MPFLCRASRVVRVSAKSVRSASLGGTVGLAAPAGAPLFGSWGSGLAGSERATAGASINATTTENALPVTSASLEDAEMAGKLGLAPPLVEPAFVRTIARIHRSLPGEGCHWTAAHLPCCVRR